MGQRVLRGPRQRDREGGCISSFVGLRQAGLSPMHIHNFVLGLNAFWFTEKGIRFWFNSDGAVRLLMRSSSSFHLLLRASESEFSSVLTATTILCLPLPSNESQGDGITVKFPN